MTNQNNVPPWASGPGEILRHAFSLLKRDSDKNRRLAMLSIDNAVELMLKTFLGLPTRITGLRITRKEYEEASESFPRLLDAMEKHAPKKLSGVDLGEIEWYHRLRNELYHDGNGLTVEREKVVVYSELAKALFKNLFDIELLQEQHSLLGDFLEEWIGIERSLVDVAKMIPRTATVQRSMADTLEELNRRGILSGSDFASIHEVQEIRNEIVHGKVEHTKVLLTAARIGLQAMQR
jgi:uncharacterized protein YutE (UPF0331/DUF86 family)